MFEWFVLLWCFASKATTTTLLVLRIIIIVVLLFDLLIWIFSAVYSEHIDEKIQPCIECNQDSELGVEFGMPIVVVQQLINPSS